MLRTRREPRCERFEHHCKHAMRQVPPATPEETTWRHSHWKERRERVRQTLLQTGASEATINRFDECGSECVVQYSPSRDTWRLRANYCHNRHCEPCRRQQANRLAMNIREKLAEARPGTIRFITLTLAHKDEPLLEQVKRLLASFRRLRSHAAWKASQDGGVAMVEIKLGNSGWHAHLHVLSEGRWIDQHALSAAWHKATGDSWVVDVRRVDDGAKASAYITKYVTKGCSTNVWLDRSRAQEYVIATRGLRAASTYGTWRGTQLSKMPTGINDWQTQISLRKLLALGKSGQPAAVRLLMILHKGRPLEEQPM